MRAAWLFALVLAIASAAAGQTESSESPELVRLSELVRMHPDDADLAWTYIRALDENARADEAIAELERFRARWPERRTDAPILLGRLLYSRGRHAEALIALEDGLYAEPRTGTGRFYRGLVLRALGRGAEAERELQVAAVLRPELEVETLMLRGSIHLEQGDQEAGEALLRRAAALDPSGETGRRAQFLLGQGPPPAESPKRISLNAYTGVETDTNVTLESGSGSGASTSKSDSRLVWGTGLSARALEREWGALSLGYAYSENAHEDLKAYNYQNHVGWASASLRLADRTLTRLDGFITDSHLDDHRYARSWSLRPNLFLTIGPRAGLTRLYADVSRINYHDEPSFDSLERGGVTYAGGLEHSLVIPGITGAWITLGGRGSRTNTTASTDLLGFKGDYDNEAGQTSLTLHVPLLFEIDLDLTTSYTDTRYLNRNVVDFLDRLAGKRSRRDRLQQLSLAISRPLTRHTRLELRWSGIDQYSNVDAYDYTRQIFGIYLRAQTD